MALPNLAASADLSARGVDVTNTTLVNTMLAVASSLVREAAGSPIAQHTATVTWWAVEPGEWLEIPVTPVRSVSSVTLDGVAVTDHKLVYGDLWRSGGWFTTEPVQVVATMICGLPEVPPHIVQLVCDLAILGMSSATAGALDARVVAERIDDYSVEFAEGAESVASAMTIPKATRLALRRQFGRGAGSVRLR